MIFKVSSGVFLVTTVIFAGLYMSEKENAAEPAVLIEKVTVEKKSKESKITAPVQRVVKNEPISGKQTETRVVLKKVSSHPELSEAEIDMMLELRNSMRKNYSRGLKREHPLMFERLALDEETENDFLLLVGERRMALRMRSSENMTEEEREEYDARKDEILQSVDNKIADLVGEKYDSYVNYRERSNQYQSIAGLNRNLSENGAPLDIEQQDQLAQVMYENRREASEDYNQKFNWDELKKSPEKADEMVTYHKERYEKMKAEADFLDDDQRKAFETHLNHSLTRYTRWAERIKSGERGYDRGRRQ